MTFSWLGGRGKGVTKAVPVSPVKDEAELLPNEVLLTYVKVSEADEDVIMLIASNVEVEYQYSFRQYALHYDYIKLSGEDKAAVDEAARKILALQALREEESRVYEQTMFDVVVWQKDMDTVSKLAEVSMGVELRGGKYGFASVALRSYTVAGLAEKVAKVQVFHDKCTKEALAAAMATIAKL